jgi:hypothetical protein
MRRTSLSWVLSLLLVLVQHGAVLHELGHLTHADCRDGTALRAQVQGLDAASCATCEAYAQIVNPMAAGAGPVAATPVCSCATPGARYAIVCAAPPTPRSRGPPQV